jgi:membrane-bound metal-dependent hydrolase YbcI (DUF457 family)
VDLLTHVFLPLTVVYVLRPAFFENPVAFGLAGFGLLPDFDKFLGTPGSLHSLVTVVPLCLLILAAERASRGEWRYAPVVTAFVGSHLVLDFIDGGPVPLVYPFFESGIGLQYPARTVFGAGPVGLWIEGPLVTMRVVAPQPGYNTYGFLTGGGIAWALVFLVLFVVLERRDRGHRSFGSEPE